MNETKKLHINHLVTQYITVKDDDLLSVLYQNLLGEYQAKLDYWCATTSTITSHETQAMFDDTLISILRYIEENGGDFVKMFQQRLTSRRTDLLRRLIVRRKHEQLEVKREGEEEAATSDIADDFNLEEEVTERITRKKKNDQRMLIEFLVSGENERTTAIVQTFLTTELKTPTAIGKHLGLDHKQVSRALNRLAAKFSTKQFGNYEDYLIAL